MTEQRRLAAIVSADVAGYSRLMGRDESGTLAALKALRQEVADPVIASHGGRIVKTTGDGLLLEFPSVVNAVRCAIEMQSAMAAKTADVPKDRCIAFRIGINLGDIIVDGDDIFGDGVNVAARLQEISAPGGICISNRVHEDVRDRLDTAFNDGGTQELKNIARPVQVWRWQPDKAAPTLAVAPTALPLPDKPSIAVLPFQNMSGDPEQEYFADGMVEDVITALSRTKALFVIARNSTFSYKGKTPDIRTVGRELGVSYVLEGSVRKVGTRVRITGQLIDAESGVHVWADRFDGDLSDIFALQDEVASRVVMAIIPTLEQLKIQRSAAKPTESLAAYDCALQCWAYIDQRTKEANQKALVLAERAIQLDPNYALAWALASGCYTQRKVWKWSEDPDREAIEAVRLTRKALELDRSDPRVLTLAGFAIGYLAGLREESVALLEKATELDPNNFLAWHQLGYACLRVGKARCCSFRTCATSQPS